MSYKHNKEKRAVSQRLRREMTPEEKHIYYDFLWRLPFTVKRQEQFGDYHADFYIERFKLVIEIDGSQHGKLENKEYDERRTLFINEFGIEVIRYSNDDINKRFYGVCSELMKKFGIAPDTLKPPRKTSKVYGFK